MYSKFRHSHRTPTFQLLMRLMVEVPYAQKASAVSSLRHILESYPLSVGIFMELLQNSDDARASKQVFVLDQRKHVTEGLYSEGLADAQGPAFMAFNDAVLKEQDWDALISIHESSKTADELKIGKYGVGFRSVFNLTDSPQILSDEYLAIFDPLCLHLGSEGMKIGVEDVLSHFPNQLSAFDFFMKKPSSPFPGTVIRCPLRCTPSKISDQVVTCHTISGLFEEFIDKELDISCLFLSNIKVVEIYEQTHTGISCLAKMEISRSDTSPTFFTATVQLERNQVNRSKEWHIAESSFSGDEAMNALSQQSDDPSTLQSIIKPSQIKIALDVTGNIQGRLFSFLPLPIWTGFPVHLHASFATDASRTNLRRDSIGLASRSRNHVLWNLMLFDSFIPRSWSAFLAELVSIDRVSNIFLFWPPERCSGGLDSYCAALPRGVVDAVLADNAAIWPVFNSMTPSPVYKNLESLVVASLDMKEDVLHALAKVGVLLTRPPRYIFNILPRNRILRPEVAHSILIENVDKISQISDGDQKLLLDYLLSTKDVSNISGLPLVPTAKGRKVALSNEEGHQVYTLLKRSEFDVFGPCDDLAIGSHLLPLHVEKALISSINVRPLTVPVIVAYLSLYTDRLRLKGEMDSGDIRWLSKFWEWMHTFDQKDELFRQISNFFLLPSTSGLKIAKTPLFKLRGEHPTYGNPYRAIGLPFFSEHFSEAAHHILLRYRLVESIWNIPALLDALSASQLVEVSPFQYEYILKHLTENLESIGQDRKQQLRDLPIFPILGYNATSNSIDTNWTAIPRGHAIRFVSKPRFVPSVKGISFVRLANIVPRMLEFLEPSHPDPMTENQIIELAFKNFTTQPGRLRLTLLQYVTQNRYRIIPAAISKLRDQAFVLAEDGQYHIPGDIVDPESSISPLYIRCLANQATDDNAEILPYLRSLELLRAHLTSEVVEERINYISSSHAPDEAVLISQSLLSLLSSSNTDFSQLPGISEKRWLPTNQGLCSARDCRYAALTPPALFDQVLATLQTCLPVPHSLHTALGWDELLPMKLIIEQLDIVLKSEDVYDIVVEIVKEFGRRKWNKEDVELLEKTVRDRRWIPTTANRLVDIRSSVFEVFPSMMDSGFYQIRADLKAEKLFQLMGCTDYPTTKTILDKLHSLDQDTSHDALVRISLSLLKSLRDPITDVERTKLLIPDVDSRLRPFSKISYNDIGEHSRLVVVENRFIAHPLLDESLASKLALDRLGLRYSDLQSVGPNMGQSLITTVRRTLEQYTNKQFLLEFLANAEDAKATEFKIVIQSSIPPESQNLCVLSPTMAYLCKLPSLVVYNNSKFTEGDFEGICQTSVGGKEGREDTIGEFGLGVLTMFHFTDLAMVISGSRVLFMDPSRKHLPLKDRESINMSLERVQQFYMDHLRAVDGLFGFDMSSPTFDGTLFVLPLRTCDGPYQPPEFIIHDFWSPRRVASDILEHFKGFAGECLLFTGIQSISCTSEAVNWSFTAEKTQTVTETEYTVTDVNITLPTNSVAQWRTIVTTSSLDRLPPECRTEAKLCRRSPFAGLAARLDKASSDGQSFSFFSTVPLSTPTSLPIHVMASFSLSPDRRQIRYDSYDTLEKKYNIWLLEYLVPPMYLFFLSYLLESGDRYYPQRWPTEKDDVLSNHVVGRFYMSHFLSSPHLLLSSLYALNPILLSPGNAVFLPKDFRRGAANRILELLRPHRVVHLPSGPNELAIRAGALTVDPKFIKREIILNPTSITSANDLEIINVIFGFLTKPKSPIDILDGLAILPLEEGSFGTLNTRGTGTPYYSWNPKDQTRCHNFPKDHFVHPKVKVDRSHLNIFNLNALSIKNFAEAKLLTFPPLTISSGKRRWIDSFWDSWEEYTYLGLKAEDVSSLSLVPTIGSSLLASINDCRNGDVLLVEGDSPEDRALRACLRDLRLPVVHVDGEIPASLSGVLKMNSYPRLNLQHVLSAIARTGIPISLLFDSLSDDLRQVFATWARERIKQISQDQISLALELPIWWSSGGGNPLTLRPASEVQLLPKDLTLQDAAEFMNDCVGDDEALTQLNKKHMSLEELPRRLHLPNVLDMRTLLNYKPVFDAWITHLPRGDHESLPVPTSALTFLRPEHLFKRDALFRAIFSEESGVFVHHEFQEYEDELQSRFSLKSEDHMDVGLFISCAERLDLEAPDVRQRSLQVFRTCNDIILSSRIPLDELGWIELRDLIFIPRRMDTVRRLDENDHGLNIPREVTELPGILSPVELVRGEFEAIAWSQLACFDEQPSPHIYLDHPDFGRPGFSVVLNHLRYLSKLSLRTMSISQRRIFYHDLKEIYRHLGGLNSLHENQELSQSILDSLKNESLFFNVDDRLDGEVNWVKGSCLAFDSLDRDGRTQDVRHFLRQFEGLLLAAGALKVQHHDLESEPRQSESQKLRLIWSSFDQLRKDKALIDVEFLANNDVSPASELLFAHRVFLAASSEYFKNFFSGNFNETVSSEIPLRIRVDHSFRSVRSFLDYVYTGNKGEDLPLEHLLEILNLSSYYHVVDLFDEVQVDIISRRMLKPDTLVQIRAEAEKLRAERLRDACTRYEEANTEYIRRFIA